MSMSAAPIGRFALFPISCTISRQFSFLRTGTPLISTLLEREYCSSSLRRLANSLFLTFRDLFSLIQFQFSFFAPSQISFSNFILSRISAISTRNASISLASSALVGMSTGCHKQLEGSSVYGKKASLKER